MSMNHEKSLSRFFTEREIMYCRQRVRGQYASLAGIFAAKEAFFKALGTGFRKGKWTEVEIDHTDMGAPFFVFYGYYNQTAMALSGYMPALSISHDGDYAVAQVVWEIS